MKRMAFVLLLLALSSQVSAQTPPPLPPIPTPLPLPNCPQIGYGNVNGIYYWGTSRCPSTVVVGFGQTAGEVEKGCNSMNTSQCNSPIFPIVPLTRGEKLGQYELTACTEPEGTQAERDQKLQKIVNECERLARHLTKLTGKSDEHSLDHLRRLTVWRNFLPSYIKYLRTSTDSVESKIESYCRSTASRKSFITAFREHEAVWSVSYLDLGRPSKRAHILNKQQSGSLVSADAIVPSPSIYATVMNIQVYKVEGPDIPGGEIYFKVYTFQEKANPGNYIHYGVQVYNAGSYTPIAGILQNRNNYGHVLSDVSGSAVYLVSSVTDLSVPVDP